MICITTMRYCEVLYCTNGRDFPSPRLPGSSSCPSSLSPSLVYPARQTTSPPIPFLQASHPSRYPFCPSTSLTINTSPNPTPPTFLALLPVKSLPSSSFVTVTRLLALLTREMLRKTGCPCRCFRSIHSLREGRGSDSNTLGSGLDGEPLEMLEMRPCRRRIDVIPREELEYGRDV
jgi:hypothetical protein